MALKDTSSLQRFYYERPIQFLYIKIFGKQVLYKHNMSHHISVFEDAKHNFKNVCLCVCVCGGGGGVIDIFQIQNCNASIYSRYIILLWYL